MKTTVSHLRERVRLVRVGGKITRLKFPIGPRATGSIDYSTPNQAEAERQRTLALLEGLGDHDTKQAYAILQAVHAQGERLPELGGLSKEELGAIALSKIKFTVKIVMGETPPPEGEAKSGKAKRRSTKALTTVHDLRDRAQLYWVGSKRNRLCFPLDDHSDGWIAYENEKKAEAARQQLLSQLSPLDGFEVGRAFEILRAFHEHAS
jgi:hypothetical protein